MKKRTGTAIAGGVLEIIAGVSWLSYMVQYLLGVATLNLNFTIDWVMFILPICFIVYGVMACVGVVKNTLKSYASVNIIFILYLIYKAVAINMSIALFLYLAIGEILLLGIATLLFYLAPKSEYEKAFDIKMKDYLTEEPKETKKSRTMLLILMSIPAIIVFILSLILIF